MNAGGFNTTEQIWWSTVCILLALFALTSVLAMGDKRVIGSVGVWLKPMKFQLSLAIHFATLGLVMRCLSDDWRNSALLLTVAIASAVATAFEIVYIMQAARQQHSHFNVGTPLHATMYALMAIGAVIITAAAGFVGALAGIDAGARLDGAARHGVALGLICGTILTVIVAFTMGGRLTHHVGVEPRARTRCHCSDGQEG
jgi:hypothetical protein